MAKRTVQSAFCSAPARAAADRILHELKVGGYSPEGISIVFLDHHADLPPPEDKGDATAASDAASSSSDIRGVVAWIAGIRPVVIPDTAPLIVGGPIAASFRTSKSGGIVAALTEFGLPDAEALRYERRIKAGQILIGLHNDNPEACACAREIYTAVGAEDIFTMMQVVTPKKALLHSRGPTRTYAA